MLRCLPAILVVLLASGCRTAMTEVIDDGPYAGIPSVEADGPIAEAQPIIPTGDPELDDFLAELAAAIDRHDWRSVAMSMDPAAFAEQRGVLTAGGERPAPEAQIISETLGVGDLYHQSPGWSGLDRIRVVTFRELAVQTPGIAGGEGFILIDGTVRLETGQTLPISFSIVSRGGARVVQVPLG